MYDNADMEHTSPVRSSIIGLTLKEISSPSPTLQAGRISASAVTPGLQYWMLFERLPCWQPNNHYKPCRAASFQFMAGEGCISGGKLLTLWRETLINFKS